MIHRDRYAYSAHPHLAVAGNGSGCWCSPSPAAVRASCTRRRILSIATCWCTRPMRAEAGPARPSCPASAGMGWSAPGLPYFRAETSAQPVALRLAHARRCGSDLPREAYRRPEELMSAQAMQAELADWTEDAASLAERYPGARRRRDLCPSLARSRTDLRDASGDRHRAVRRRRHGMRGGVEIDGEILLPLCDVPNYERVFIVRSTDGGASWSAPQPVAAGESHAFEEPARCISAAAASSSFFATTSPAPSRRDVGRRRTQLEPPGLYRNRRLSGGSGRLGRRPRRLRDGRRREPFGITLYLSDDAGRTWNADTPVLSATIFPIAILAIPRPPCVPTAACSSPTTPRRRRRHRHSRQRRPAGRPAGRSGKGASHGEG